MMAGNQKVAVFKAANYDFASFKDVYLTTLSLHGRGLQSESNFKGSRDGSITGLQPPCHVRKTC